MILLEDPTTLSLLFHLNSEPWLNDEAYKSGAANQEFKRPEGILSEITWRAQPVEFAATSTTRAPDQFRTCRKCDFAGTVLTAISRMDTDTHGTPINEVNGAFESAFHKAYLEHGIHGYYQSLKWRAKCGEKRSTSVLH